MSRVITIMQSYLGLKEDGGSNKFLESNPLHSLLKAAGHQDGEAWCAYLIEGVHAKGYPEHAEWLDQHVSANCVQFLKNMVAAGVTLSATPMVGWVAVYQLYKGGKPTSKGHTNLIIRFAIDRFMTIDGNSGGKNEREGTGGMVAENTWTLGKFNPDGLNYMGCLDLEGFLANLKSKP